MTRYLLLTLPAMMIAAPATAQPRDVYRALGTEPFWSLDIGRSTMTFKPATGRATTVTKPRAIANRAGETYRARGMTVEVVHRRCSDGMSDRTYRDTVKVTLGRRVYSGCGGAIGGTGTTKPGDRFAGTSWTIASVDGRMVRTRPAPIIRFANGRISGKICNSFDGPYSLNRDRLSASRIVATQMACQGEPMQVERRVFQILAASTDVAWSRDTVTLISRNGTVTLQRSR